MMINLTESDCQLLIEKLHLVEKYKDLELSDLRFYLKERYKYHSQKRVDSPTGVVIKFEDENCSHQELNIATLSDSVRDLCAVINGNKVTGLNPDIQIPHSTYLLVVGAIKTSNDFDMFFMTELKEIADEIERTKEQDKNLLSGLNGYKEPQEER